MARSKFSARAFSYSVFSTGVGILRTRSRSIKSGKAAIDRRDLAARLFTAGLNLAEHRRGGMFVVLEDPRGARQLVSGIDLLENEQRERAGAKNQLHYLLRNTRVTEVSPPFLQSISPTHLTS